MTIEEVSLWGKDKWVDPEHPMPKEWLRRMIKEKYNHPSIAGFFREQGYYTGRVSKIYHMGVPGGIERGDPGGDDPDSWDYAYNVLGPETLSPGILELLSPGSLHYGANFSRMIIPDELEGTQTDYMAVSQAIAFLENRTRPLPPNGTNKRRLKPDAPFFLGIGLVRPHVPLIAPENCFPPLLHWFFPYILSIALLRLCVPC